MSEICGGGCCIRYFSTAWSYYLVRDLVSPESAMGTSGGGHDADYLDQTGRTQTTRMGELREEAVVQGYLPYGPIIWSGTLVSG
jgi:hypothetical protein